jgi:hypothetical protein
VLTYLVQSVGDKNCRCLTKGGVVLQKLYSYVVEFDFGCKFMFVTGKRKIEFYAAAIILSINANEGPRFGVRNASFRQGCYR